MIIGTNFGIGNTVDIQTVTETPMPIVSVISNTQILATVPAGIAANTYHITVTNNSGTSARTAADTFEVMSGPEVPATPSQIKDFNATDGENGQSTLTWTNPSDNDMAVIEVRRYDNSFPAAYDPAGTLVYTGIPTPGATVSTVNTGLANSTTYYYVAFIGDTSGNWSVVDHTTPEVNANTATTASQGDTTAPASIETLSAAVGVLRGEIRIDWTAVGDDGNTGTATSYIVKYSYTGPITTEALFNAATTYNQSWAPKTAGQAESQVMSSLTPGANIWVSIKASDEAGNVGSLGNCAETIVRDSVPVPTITKVYPQKGPNNQTNQIVIIGTNLYNDMIAKIGNTNLLNTHQYSSTMVQAEVPAGLTPATYEITITCPGGTYDDASHTNPNNDFTVILPGADTVSPEVVKNFNATDGENGQSTLTWTNPSATDLREIVVMRKEGSYPINHSDAAAVLAYQTLIPEPGAAVNYVNTGLINGTKYYYAVFSRDTSNNWNNTVDSTTPEVNADTATPGASPNTITVRTPNGGEVWNFPSQQNITWESTGTIANVSIEVSINAGSSWSPVATVANSGTYSWTVTNTPTTEARIKISDASNPSVSDTSNANFTIQTGVATGEKTFAIVYISETQAENWISVPFNSAKVAGVPINTIGDLMTSLVVFTPATGDIITLMWNDNATQAPKSAMRDYNGTDWNSWDPQMESQPITVGAMYIVTISNPGRSTINASWTVSGNVPNPGEVKFSMSYLSETQAENWISVPNQAGLATKGALLDSLTSAFAAQSGDIVTLREYNNATQTTASAMRDYNGTSWNIWDPAKEAEPITLGDTFIFSLSNSSGRTTFTVIWP